MLPRLLLTTGLLLSTLSCAKKTDPVASLPTNIGRYAINGKLINCTAGATLDASSGTSLLTITLTTTPEPSTGPDAIRLICRKSAAASLADYTLVQTQRIYGGTASAISATTPGDLCTIIGTSGGGFSGTFSYSAPFSNWPITDGVFTDVRL